MNVPDERRLVYTSILLYAHDRAAGARHERARVLVRERWDRADGCVSLQVLQEFYVTVTRKLLRPLTDTGAAEIVADLAT